ncbi:MAG TPA: aminotransferase class I/II-fold pyridoxal phosphate-dependent enzyme [Gaiellaceae bacterium]|nr:aminotransferase class I/II-fold pyridoxal phosphate-dependent enzyme [Gaiellaceae bacterium]
MSAQTHMLSPTLAVNEAVRLRKARGEQIVHLAFGEAGLPVHPLLRAALGDSSSANAYGSVAGSTGLRSSVAGYYARRGLETEPSQVVVGPGSKALLYALLLVLDGDLVLPRPSWVSYEPQARLVGKEVVRVDIPSAAGGVPDPEALRSEVGVARERGLDPRILILNHPDNPTGTHADANLLADVLGVARECGLQVVSDEIYAELAHAPETFISAAVLDPDNVVVTGGLSKSHALGGWRIGVLRAPPNAFGRELVDRLTSAASEIWSCLPAPIDAAAEVAYDEPEALVEFVASARTLHATVSEAAYAVVAAAGLTCRKPSAAFYLYPDFEPLRAPLAERGIATSSGLAQHLLEDFAVAVLPGAAFGDDGLRVRMATSLLYGDGDEGRWEALSAGPAAADLPRVRSALLQLAEALETLAAGAGPR